MTYQRRSSNKTEGFLIIDIMLAMSVSLVFIVLIAGLQTAARGSYTRAKENKDSVYSGQSAVCAADLTNTEIVGSYEWIRDVDADSGSSSAVLPYLLAPQITEYHLPMSTTTILTDIEVRGDIAYVSTMSGQSGIYIFRLDVNGQSTLVSSLLSGPGIAAIAIDGRYIYAAGLSIAAELQVFAQTNDHILSSLKRYQVPLPRPTDTPPKGSSIAFADGTVYLGTEKWAGPEFSVIRVTNPAVPVRTGWFETGTRIGDIQTKDGLAYLADADQQQLRILDARVSGTSTLLGSYAPSGWERQEGQTISLSAGRIGFGRTSGGFDIPSDYEFFVSSSSNPFSGGVSSINMPGGVYGIVFDDSHAYVATREAGSELQVVDLRNGLKVSQKVPLPTAPGAMTCDRDALYVISHTTQAIYKITFGREYAQ